ncbi:MAG: DUF1850 domain-containing protein [Paracoccus sp. (in: a-proteobacteria)]|uniref:DUF1850 domain-containing protein n=1 Tax=Paracoccus sp. TaxID=267 RepID=UPI0026DFC2AD|nr:DUF1850 domain-containing protein [Paracoccus sp. (in: a-proteobacteria)]MDO5630265.1 DUF1850 domain-containing protein [Paracoccus sp. (in: a-proteobacteria)]
MSGCLMVGATMLMLGGAGFQLEWTHSVERSGWREDWRIQGGKLHLTRAAVRGSGAGMEPGAGAQLQNGWWVWSPDLPPQPALLLAASGATGGDWRLCDGNRCQVIGTSASDPIDIRPCP